MPDSPRVDCTDTRTQRHLCIRTAASPMSIALGRRDNAGFDSSHSLPPFHLRLFHAHHHAASTLIHHLPDEGYSVPIPIVLPYFGTALPPFRAPLPALSRRPSYESIQHLTYSRRPKSVCLPRSFEHSLDYPRRPGPVRRTPRREVIMVGVLRAGLSALLPLAFLGFVDGFYIPGALWMPFEVLPL